LTGVLERMERDGLITRTRAQEDQRRLLVSLTPQSRKLVTEIGPRIDEQYRQLESRFGQDGLEDIYRALDRLIELGGNA
ncbi:MAG: homoprotocatechuate degradation operon regulator HpaR, partial [Burkholderia sp.]|nr:homoprotocatechuate degradation operon regulator HpaR [Burkholderia sp.]